MRRLITWTGQLVTLTAAVGLMARYLSPEVFWPPAIIALLLPALLLATLLFVIYLLFSAGWRAAFFPTVVLLLAIPLIGHLIAWSTKASPLSETHTLTLVTGNQRAFRAVDKSGVDSARVSKTVRDFRADILLLQEVHTSRSTLKYTPSILKAGNYNGHHQSEGTTIATYGSNFTPVSAHFKPPNEYNGFIVTDTNTPLGKLRIINAHLESNQISDMSERIADEGGSLANRTELFAKMFRGYGRATRVRAQQAAEIRKAIDASPYPVILGGDFNDVPSSYIYRELLSPRLRDAWSERGSGLGTTFTGKLPGLRIDYFMVDTSLQVVSIERLTSEWSDHRALRLAVSH